MLLSLSPLPLGPLLARTADSGTGPATALLWTLSLVALASATYAYCTWRRVRQKRCALGALDEALLVLEAVERGEVPEHIDSSRHGPFETRMVAIGDLAERLAARGRHLSAIIDSEPECVKTVAADGTLVDMNPAGLEMIGAGSIDEVRGERVVELLAPEWRAPFLEMHEAVLEGEARTLTFELVGLQGTRRWMETHAVPLRGTDGELLQLAITHDVSARRQHEIDLREARDSAEAASRTKTEFLANMSHELRTPLTAILGYAELLDDGESSLDDTARGLRAIRGSADHLLSLISDILDISKIEANRLEIESLPCDLGELAQSVAESMRARAEDGGIRLDVEVEGDVPPTVLTDPMRIRQILVNLVGNAIKFTQEGGVRIEVVAASSQRMELRVTDTGMGIEAETLAQLFTPFTQADSSTTRRFGGTGLGLSISRRLARMLGGDVSATSVPGEGSTFTLSLDVEIASPDDVARDARDEPNPPAPFPSRGDRTAQTFRGRVLLVEDNPVNRRVLRKMLERLGLAVDEAVDGAVGTTMAREALAADEAYDLVLLDMHMPVQDGYTTAGQLRDEGYPAPVIALTASAMAEDRALCLEAGCDDYASKPVQTATLRRIVGRYLDADGAHRTRSA